MFISSSALWDKLLYKQTEKCLRLRQVSTRKRRFSAISWEQKVHKRIRIMVICSFHFKGLSANVQVYIATCDEIERDRAKKIHST